MRKQVEGLKHHTHLFTDFQAVLLVVVEGNAVNDNRAAVRFFQPIDTAKQGRFTRPRGSHDYYHLATADISSKILDCLHTPGEGFAHIINHNDVVVQFFFTHLQCPFHVKILNRFSMEYTTVERDTVMTK
ncbi:hypothetical protein ES703_97166 [subsurface metagenome]